MAILTIPETARLLEGQDRFCILTHRRPDGDTLGSAALLCRGLRQLGKDAYVLKNPETTPKYSYLIEGLTKDCPATDDALICVDVASAGMLPEALAAMAERILLRIDHHRNEASFTTHALVEPASAACGQIVYKVLLEMGVALDEAMAIALYTAISTDTGCFRFANTQPETYEVAAACARVTTGLRELNHKIFETNTLARLKMQGWIVENALFLQGGKICICAIPLEVEQRLGVTEDDMDNISGFPRSIAGVEIAATLRQESSGKVKLSVRCMPEYDASGICAKLGGGGHKGAAGASMEMPMEQAVQTLIGLLEHM